MSSSQPPTGSSGKKRKEPHPDQQASTKKTLDPIKASDERLRKKGEKMLKEITENSPAFVYVEVSRSGRAKCRAGRDCLHVEPNGPQTQQIKDVYRICVHGTSFSWFGDGEFTSHYYHILCFSSMICIEDLISPNKFRLMNGKWGLLVRKWYEHRGCINVEAVSAYIAAYKAYEKQMKKSNKDDESQPALEPTLSEYTTGDTVSHDLWDILNHDDCEKMKAQVPEMWPEDPFY